MSPSWLLHVVPKTRCLTCRTTHSVPVLQGSPPLSCPNHKPGSQRATPRPGLPRTFLVLHRQSRVLRNAFILSWGQLISSSQGKCCPLSYTMSTQSPRPVNSCSLSHVPAHPTSLSPTPTTAGRGQAVFVPHLGGHSSPLPPISLPPR